MDFANCKSQIYLSLGMFHFKGFSRNVFILRLNEFSISPYNLSLKIYTFILLSYDQNILEK